MSGAVPLSPAGSANVSGFAFAWAPSTQQSIAAAATKRRKIRLSISRILFPLAADRHSWYHCRP